ncbi:MAG: acyl-CoA dehydrogenase family protein [Methanophagales archaeon]|nr:acyl-CoA dehydrogenase family protein [Methanophagales archaeon]
MEWDLSEREKGFQQIAREFAQSEVLPLASEIDRSGKIPKGLRSKLLDLKFQSIPLPRKFGGASASMLSFVLAVAEIAKASPSVAFFTCASLGGMFPLHFAGSEEQKAAFLRPLCEGEKLGAFALTEPQAGSDPISMQTTAVREGDEFVLNGEKAFITNAALADTYTIIAYTDKAKKHKGMSAFIVEKGTKGMKFTKMADLLGMRGCIVAGIRLEDCAVPKENLLGRGGDGFKIAMETVNIERVALSGVGVGIAEACLELACEYAKVRKQFSQPIANFEAVQFMLADTATEIEAARLLTFKAANLADAVLYRFSQEQEQRGLSAEAVAVSQEERRMKIEAFRKTAAMAKLFSSEVALRAASNAVQIHGGFGCTKECPAERFFRDARILSIAVGTSEIQRITIAREVLK